jgi:hypothetical protein
MLKKYKRDVIVILSLLAVSLLSLLLVFLFSKTGECVTVSVDGEYIGTYSLLTDREISISGGKNILKIDGGEAFMTHADCPDHVCVNTGKISKVGQSIICLPNKVTVTVIGNSDSGVDLESK